MNNHVVKPDVGDRLVDRRWSPAPPERRPPGVRAECGEEGRCLEALCSVTADSVLRMKTGGPGALPVVPYPDRPWRKSRRFGPAGGAKET